MAQSHVHFQGRSEAVLAVTITFLVLSTLFVSLRMLSRAAIVKKISIDDYFIVLAWVIAFGLCVAICYGCAWGLGRHEDSIPNDWQEALRTADYVFSVLYQPALMATKTSILAFYLTLPTSNRNFKWACIATLVVVNAGGLALGLFTIFQCSPVGAVIQFPTPMNASCTDIITIYLSSTPLNMITDLALLFLPMPILTGMRLPRKQKIILVITFSAGAFVAAVDVVRIVYLQAAAQTRLLEIHNGNEGKHGSINERTDFSWYASQSFMWSAIEVNVGIMCACVPGLKPLVSRFLPYMLRDKSDPESKNASVSDPSANSNGNGNAAYKEPDLPHMAAYVAPEDANDGPDDGPMGMMDFLTTPDMKELPLAARKEAAKSKMSPHAAHHEHNFFDFVDMRGEKSLPSVTTRESLFPLGMVTVLFFIWGFEYGLLDVLNSQFQRVAKMSSGQSTAIHSAYFAGYFFGPLSVGRLVLKHWGFKACYTVGLSIYGCGTLIFWPAAVLTSFPAFVITNFIVAFGLSILEVSANPFIFLCGPQRYGEIRLAWSQGVQAIGSIVAPLIANKAFVRQNLHAPSLVDTQWAYLGISLFTILLAVAYYYVPLPEATDEQLEEAAGRPDHANKARIGNTDLIWITLGLGVFSQWCYVGGQEANASSFGSYLAAVEPSYNTANYMAVAHTVFALSRFLGGAMCFWIKPRLVLLFFYTGAIVFGIVSIVSGGNTGTATLIMIFFFEGPIFPLTFAQALRGLGRHTKTGAVFITTAVSGGAIFAPISNHITNADNRPKLALVVGVAVFAAATLFPIGLTTSPLARSNCDPIKDDAASADTRQSSTSSRPLSFITSNNKLSAESPNVEWKEQRTSYA